MDPAELDAVRERLRWDTPAYLRECLQVVDPRGKEVPFNLRPAQLKLDAAFEKQRQEGKPQRAIILKARQLGFSTYGMGKGFQRVTQTRHHRMFTVAHDKETAGQLLAMCERFYASMPDWASELGIRPNLSNFSRQKEMHFGERSREARVRGDLGLNSWLKVDTANEFEGGRGFTFHTLWLSEIAFWADIKRKLTALLQAVPDEPETLIGIESTANGMNLFYKLWRDAEEGRSDYIPVFAAWWEDERYRKPFASPEDKQEFISDIGLGPYGADEPRLIEEFGLDTEQLHWRRWAIANKTSGDVDAFKTEYPSDPNEAFRTSGRNVFSQAYISKVLDRTNKLDEPKRGILKASGFKVRRAGQNNWEVPTGTLWVPEEATGFDRNHPFWRVWEEPVPDGQYVLAVDVAGGEEATSSGDVAWHAIEVVNHKTLEQCAEYRSRVDGDELAMQAFLIGLWFNEGWMAVETTGGWGIPIVKRLWRDFGYRRLYMRTPVETRFEKQTDRLGWDTNRRSKPMVEDNLRELLREGNDGIRSRLLAHELETYVKDEAGRSGPTEDEFSDLLMAYMIAQQVAREKTVRPDRKNRPDTYYTPRDGRTGW